ncbi:16910_t:CDS:2 [Dentiscutata erythropus]|uniref:16910_t:CDS:1 n=1 Tax=Dentiscutata erythropus TaxID=1348616 RepID=A0A9N8WGQ2_9GLOM|nr:16910_t:CDS:2 [Dentiscutata erythropus]
MDMKTPPHHNSAVQPANSPKSNSDNYQLPSINRKGSAGPVSPRSCNRTEGQGVSATVCANCGTTTTPLWRRAPNGETICNACGLYLKARNTVRPPWLKRNAIKKSTPAVNETPDNNNSNGTCPGDGHCDGTGGSSSCDGCPAFNQHQVNRQALICANCGTNTTPLWRRDESGNTICNACGLYFKLHNVHRPVTMKRSVIKRRKRVALATSPPPPTNQSGGSDNEHSSRKSRIHHPPTPASTPGSERGYISSEDEISVDELSLSNRKRKVDDPLISNKRRCSSSARQVPPIEDYVCSKLSGAMWDERRKRSLSPVEPLLANQVHIHHNRIMGTPSVPLPSVFPPQYNDGSSSPSQNSSSSISALLNPTTPTSSGHHQLPPLSSIPSANMASPTTPPHVGLPIPTNSPISTHQPQSSSVSDRNSIQLLQAHRQELQREVSHLSMLLNKTTAILVDLDKAITNGSHPNTPYGSPERSLVNSGNNYGNSHTIHHGMPTPPPSDAYLSLPPLAPSGSDGSISR